MSKLTRQQDAYGQAMWDAIDDPQAACVVEREDGFVDVDHTRHYMSEFKDWAWHERQGLSLVRGRVLDVGCGAGRVALHLQEKGQYVMGIDNSPLAVKTCKQRGVKNAKVMSITQAGRKLGIFDTIVMYGNNFGLMGSFKRARWLLRKFRAMTGPDAMIIAESNDPYETATPAHLAYHRANRKHGRMGGQVRIRIRYRTHATPWFDYLMVSKDEMRRIVDGTGWKIGRFFDSKGSVYIAVLEKEQRT